MRNEEELTIKDIEKSAIYSAKDDSSFTEKEEFARQLADIKYKWNIAEFPAGVIQLLQDFVDVGRVYVLIDKKFRVLVYSYVKNLIQLLEEQQDRDNFLSKVKNLGKTFEDELIPYCTAFIKLSNAGIIVFYVLLKGILSAIISDEVRGKSTKFVKQLENETTRLTNSILSFVVRKSRVSLTGSVKDFLDTVLIKIPIIAKPLDKINLNDIKDFLAQKGFSLKLFEELYSMLVKELNETMQRSVLNAIFAYEISSKEELLRSIGVELTRKTAEEIVTNLKKVVEKKLSFLKEKVKETTDEIEKNFRGFDQASRILWDAITSEIKSVKSGKDDNTLEEVVDRSGVLSSLITKKMWSIRELLLKKKKLDKTLNDIKNLLDVSPEELIKYSQKKTRTKELDKLANFYFAFVKHYGKNVNMLPQNVLVEAEKILKLFEKELESTEESPFYEKRFLTRRYYPERFVLRFIKCFEDTIVPLFVESVLMKFFIIWPPVLLNENQRDISRYEKEAYYIGNFIIPNNKILKMGNFPVLDRAKSIEKRTDITPMIIRNFSNVVAVLIFDIRGSTFMGTRLADAKRESDIRKEFNNRMLKIAERYGGFPIKDTGDGGIILFAGNSRELYSNVFAPGRLGKEWIRTRYKDADLELKEGKESARMALLTAKGMLLEAQRFVNDNIQKYSDWFKHEKERELLFKGVSYAQLPPSYKRIFQIGVGIASGHIGKDVYFSINAYGDPDITGNLVRDANLYSKARNPESSVILMDTTSLINLLLSEDNVEPIVENVKTVSLSETEPFDFLFDTTLNLAIGHRGPTKYKLKKFGLVIERIGKRIFEKTKGERIVPVLSVSELGVTISDRGQIKDPKGGVVKFLYEVSIEE